jgi:hypothetical protein
MGCSKRWSGLGLLMLPVFVGMHWVTIMTRMAAFGWSTLSIVLIIPQGLFGAMLIDGMMLQSPQDYSVIIFISSC